MRIRVGAASAALLAMSTMSAVAATSRPPLVLAVDGSRSISQAQLHASADLVGRFLEALPADASVGLIVFEDAARWEVPLGAAPSRVAQALGALIPAGRFTVLRDALIVAAHQLTEGGVVLLVSDGRDEDSAATVEDVAQACAAHRVRIVAFAAGRSVDEHALRRLTLLTGGVYLGRQEGVGTDTLATAIGQAGHGLEPPEPVATPAPPPALATPLPAPTAAPRPAASFPLVPAAIGAVVIAAAVALIWGLRGRRKGRTCPRCGSLIAPWESECSYCLVADIAKQAPTAEPAAPVADEQAPLDPSVFNKAPVDKPLDKTFALQDQNILTVRQHGKPPRSYFLHPDEAFSVGRASRINSLSLDDPTMSAQHFKIIPKNGAYYIVDLDTMNGTIVNGDRVRARRLRPGDVIRAGEVEFELKVQFKRVT
ncbi:MAG: FHA domain-containing protein [Acidobacteriia bacterium]|nr:FHA domain-containing protein [Terriglobia bacterium]